MKKRPVPHNETNGKIKKSSNSQLAPVQKKYAEAEASDEKVAEGANKAVEYYIDDLIVLGSE